jgi:hypothetical protein
VIFENIFGFLFKANKETFFLKVVQKGGENIEISTFEASSDTSNLETFITSEQL